MVRPSSVRPSRLKAAIQSAGALSAAAVLATALAAPAQAQEGGVSQLEDLQSILNSGAGEALPSIPGSPSLPNMPGLGQAGGGDAALADGVRAVADPFVPEGGFREQNTSAPSDGVEESTRPECAPNVFVGVPGTFEINRDDDPNQPVGLLGGFVGPLKSALGGQLSTTFINYDGDAGVNGTAYQRSVDSGQKKTLATIVDVSQRCEDSQIFLAGFSQGAEIAGNVAMEIGQRRTAVEPGRIGGVVLFSDPRRDENSNLIVGTAQGQPMLPEIITGAIDEALKDPTIAQLRSAVDPVNDLSRIFGGQDLLPSIPSSAAELLDPKTGNSDTGTRTGTSGNAGASGTGGGLTDTGGGLPEVNDGGTSGNGGTGGGLPNVGGGGLPNTGGGLPEVGGASYGDDGTFTVDNGLHWLPYGASGPPVVGGDYSHPAGGGPTIVLADNETTSEGTPVTGQQVLDSVGADLTEEEATEFAAAFRAGECGQASLVSCLTSYADNGNTLDTESGDEETAETEPRQEEDTDSSETEAAASDADSSANPYEKNLVTADGEPADLETLAEMCLGRGSAADCGGSHPPADLDEATGENRPSNATALVTISSNPTDGCDTSPRRDNCSNGVTRTDISSVSSVPARDDLISFWETADNAADLKVMQAYGAGLAGQVAAAQHAFNGAAVFVPSGISYLVETGTAETKALALADVEEDGMVAVNEESTDEAIGSDEARALLTQGWQLGRTGSDERSRASAVEALYAIGGCDAMTLQDCISAHAKDSGKPESAVTTASLVATAARAEAEGSDRSKVPAAFAEECLTKSYEDCASGAASRGVPSLPPIADVSDESPSTGAARAATQSTPESTSASTSTSKSSSAPYTSTSAEADTGQDADAELDSSTQNEPESTTGQDADETTGEDAEPTTSEKRAAGAEPTTSEKRAAGAEPTTSAPSQADDEADSTATATAVPGTTGQSAPSREGERVDIEAITMEAVSGGGLSGPREADFGELTGRVASPCVPGDIVCSLPEDSQLARSLVQLGRNVALNVNDIADAEGPTRMGGMLAVQAVNTVLQVTELPELKMSPETIIAIINLVAGVGLIHVGDVPAGTALISSTITQLPTAIPEVIEQLQDIPAIIEGLPEAGANAAENLGLVTDRVGDAFDTAGLGNPTDLSNLPAMLPGLVQALVQDNTGLIELATNPMYYTSGEKHDAFDTLPVAGDTNAIQWHQRWLTKLGEELQDSR